MGGRRTDGGHAHLRSGAWDEVSQRCATDFISGTWKGCRCSPRAPLQGSSPTVLPDASNNPCHVHIVVCLTICLTICLTTCVASYRLTPLTPLNLSPSSARGRFRSSDDISRNTAPPAYPPRLPQDCITYQFWRLRFASSPATGLLRLPRPPWSMCPACLLSSSSVSSAATTRRISAQASRNLWKTFGSSSVII